MTATTPSGERWRGEEIVLGVLLLAVVAHGIYWLFVGIANPIMDVFAFRQTQTAISVYWLAQEGFSFVYSTPVLGYPWQIPFEFPVYQWLVLLVHQLGVPLDPAGRVVSYVFYLLCALPAYRILERLGTPRAGRLLFLTLLFASPLYVFWGRTFMIESTALFFGLAWLWGVLEFLRRPSGVTLALTALAGIAGILAKSTTFSMFGLLGGAALGWHALTLLRRRANLTAYAPVFWLGGACAVVLACGLAWVAYTDAIKHMNELGARTVSSALGGHNFGRLEMRVAADFWFDRVAGRMLPDTLGYFALPALVVIGFAAAGKRQWLLAAGGAAAFLLPLFVFTNLHKVHHYYQYANGLFLLAGVAAGLSALLQGRRRWLAYGCAGAIVAGQMWHFHGPFADYIKHDQTQRSRYKIAVLAQAHVPAGRSLLVLGEDWSSEVHYYAGRKGIALPYWASTEIIKSILADPNAYMGDEPLGGIVDCGTDRYGKRAPLLDAFVEARDLAVDIGPCQLWLEADLAG